MWYSLNSEGTATTTERKNVDFNGFHGWGDCRCYGSNDNGPPPVLTVGAINMLLRIVTIMARREARKSGYSHYNGFWGQVQDMLNV